MLKRERSEKLHAVSDGVGNFRGTSLNERQRYGPE